MLAPVEHRHIMNGNKINVVHVIDQLPIHRRQTHLSDLRDHPLILIRARPMRPPHLNTGDTLRFQLRREIERGNVQNIIVLGNPISLVRKPAGEGAVAHDRGIEGINVQYDTATHDPPRRTGIGIREPATISSTSRSILIRGQLREEPAELILTTDRKLEQLQSIGGSRHRIKTLLELMTKNLSYDSYILTNVMHLLRGGNVTRITNLLVIQRPLLHLKPICFSHSRDRKGDLLQGVLEISDDPITSSNSDLIELTLGGNNSGEPVPIGGVDLPLIMLITMSEEPIDDEIAVEPQVMEVDELRGLQGVLHERINRITQEIQIRIVNTDSGPQPDPSPIGKTSV